MANVHRVVLVTSFCQYSLVSEVCTHVCFVDESLAPMDDFLRASLPVTVGVTLMSHLPELDVTQPDKVRCDPMRLLAHQANVCLSSLN